MQATLRSGGALSQWCGLISISCWKFSYFHTKHSYIFTHIQATATSVLSFATFLPNNRVRRGVCATMAAATTGCRVKVLWFFLPFCRSAVFSVTIFSKSTECVRKILLLFIAATLASLCVGVALACWATQ